VKGTSKDLIVLVDEDGRKLRIAIEFRNHIAFSLEIERIALGDKNDQAIVRNTLQYAFEKVCFFIKARNCNGELGFDGTKRAVGKGSTQLAAGGARPVELYEVSRVKFGNRENVMYFDITNPRRTRRMLNLMITEVSSELGICLYWSGRYVFTPTWLS
jgi:hypothetical protein